jgi:IS1 family transposase
MVLFEKEKKQLWVFVSLDAQSKFWVNFELGSRTNHTANRLVMGWKKAAIPNSKFATAQSLTPRGLNNS